MNALKRLLRVQFKQNNIQLSSSYYFQYTVKRLADVVERCVAASETSKDSADIAKALFDDMLDELRKKNKDDQSSDPLVIISQYTTRLDAILPPFRNHHYYHLLSFLTNCFFYGFISTLADDRVKKTSVFKS